MDKKITIKAGIFVAVIALVLGAMMDRCYHTSEVRTEIDTLIIPSPPAKIKLDTMWVTEYDIPENVGDSLLALSQLVKELQNKPPEVITRYIAKDYFTIKKYDTLLVNKPDTLLARLKMQIQRNSVLDLSFEYQTYTRTITKQKTVMERSKTHLYLGGGVGFDNTLAAQVAIQRKRFLFNGSYTNKGTVTLGAAYRIF